MKSHKTRLSLQGRQSAVLYKHAAPVNKLIQMASESLKGQKLSGISVQVGEPQSNHQDFCLEAGNMVNAVFPHSRKTYGNNKLLPTGLLSPSGESQLPRGPTTNVY